MIDLNDLRVIANRLDQIPGVNSLEITRDGVKLTIHRNGRKLERIITYLQLNSARFPMHLLENLIWDMNGTI